MALITALAGAGLPTNEFHFAGFLSSKKSARQAKLKELSSIKSTLIFYESPHRLKAMLEDLLSVFGERKVVLARELTKLHEQFQRGSLKSVNGQTTMVWFGQ